MRKLRRGFTSEAILTLRLVELQVKPVEKHLTEPYQRGPKNETSWKEIHVLSMVYFISSNDQVFDRLYDRGAQCSIIVCGGTAYILSRSTPLAK
jgi:hypothetical protein